MSTSRKPRVKLAKHRRSARKEPEPKPAESSTAETQASTERGTVAARSALTGTQFVCFCHWLSGQKLFAGLSLFTCPFQSLRRARRAHRDRRRLEPLGHGNAPREPPQQVGRAVCLSHSPSEILAKYSLCFFLPQLAAPGKETAKPQPPTLDYPSDELTSSELSDSEPEEAPAENLSTGWSERATRVDTQFHGDHVGPQNIPDHINHESTALSFLELFLDADFWGCCAAKQSCEPSRSSSPSPLHTTPRILGQEPEPEPAESSTAETQASTERGTVAAHSALTGTQFVCFCHWLSGQKLFAGLRLFTCTFQSLRRARRAHRDRRRLEPLGHGNAPREPPQQVGRAVCLSHSPSEILAKYSLCFFLPQLAAPGKESAKPPPPTLTARRRPHQTATPQAPSTLRLRRARTRRISSSRTTPQTS